MRLSQVEELSLSIVYAAKKLPNVSIQLIDFSGKCFYQSRPEASLHPRFPIDSDYNYPTFELVVLLDGVEFHRYQMNMKQLEMGVGQVTLLINNTFYTPCSKEQTTVVDANQVKSSYTFDTILSYLEQLKQEHILKKELNSLFVMGDQVLHKNTSEIQKQLCKLASHNNIKDVDTMILVESQAIQSLSLQLKNTREMVSSKREFLQGIEEKHDQIFQQYSIKKDGLELSKQALSKLLISCMYQRQALIAQLKEIFPLNKAALSIRGLVLPNTMYAGHDDDKIATALGFVCMFVDLLSFYINVPLRYQLVPKSSRSLIFDMNEAYPLYAKGSEKIRFEYAVFLLNKNIEQLMHHVGLFVRNLRTTIPNLVDLTNKVNEWSSLSIQNDVIDWTDVSKAQPIPSDLTSY